MMKSGNFQRFISGFPNGSNCHILKKSSQRSLIHLPHFRRYCELETVKTQDAMRQELTRKVYHSTHTGNSEMRSPYPKGLMFISFPSLHSRRSLPTRRLEWWWGPPPPTTTHPSLEVTASASEAARRPQTPKQPTKPLPQTGTNQPRKETDP